MKPKVSVIIPCYNVENYLRQCLDSIVNQTLADIEVLCVDDGSTDATLKILESYADSDIRIKIFTQNRKGQGVARNKAIELATGEYLIFVDSDDWLELNALELLYNKIISENVEVVQFNYKNFNEFNNRIEMIDFAKHVRHKYGVDLCKEPYFNWQLFKEDCLFDLDVHVWNRIYSLDFIKRHGIKFAPTTNGEDHLFWIGVLLNSEKICYIDEYLYNYRTRLNSSVTTKHKVNMCVFENIECIEAYISSIGLVEPLEVELEKYKTQVLVWHYYQLPEEELKFYLNKCKEVLSENQYKLFLKKIGAYTTFLQRVFSIKNNGRHKVITLFGLKIKIKRG